MGIQTRDERFLGIVDADLALTTLETGFQFTEGPAWHPVEKHLTFSDIFASTLYRWSAGGGLETFRTPSHQANGNTYDLQGRLLTCEHQSSRVTRTDPDGSVTVLASHYDGKELNSPNDIVVRRDGTVWFTDPTYGRIDPTGGRPRAGTRLPRRVYRFDPADGSLTCLARDFEMPNGLAFTPDQGALYVADTPRLHIRKFGIEGGRVPVGRRRVRRVNRRGPGRSGRTQDGQRRQRLLRRPRRRPRLSPGGRRLSRRHRDPGVLRQLHLGAGRTSALSS